MEEGKKKFSNKYNICIIVYFLENIVQEQSLDNNRSSTPSFSYDDLFPALPANAVSKASVVNFIS